MISELELLAENEEVIGLYDYEKDQKRIQKSMREEGYDEGYDEGIIDGIEQGIEQGKEKLIKEMIINNYSDEEIIKISKISSEELDRIKKDL